MINCSKCFAAIPDEMLFCLNCGTRLEVEQETVVIPKAQPKPPPPRIIIMPPIPSRTEIAFTWIAEKFGSNAGRWLIAGVVALTVGVIAGLVFIDSIALHK